jgi:hypothetical protein
MLGFEVLSLDSKDAPSTIPDLSAPHMAHLARRLDGTRALGMFRISENEFLLCYDGNPMLDISDNRMRYLRRQTRRSFPIKSIKLARKTSCSSSYRWKICSCIRYFVH